MRVVIDTNVLISAALKAQSIPAQTIYIVERSGLLLKSQATEDEFFKVINRRHLVSIIEPPSRAWLSGLFAKAEPIEITEPVVLCRDPQDDKFLELALNGNADAIVSGDRDLLELVSVRDIPIISPADFMRVFIR